MAPAETSVEDWPMLKFRSAYRYFKSIDDGEQQLAVILCMGNFSPLHHSHLEMIEKAKDRLERAGYAVLGGWLSPSSDKAAKCSLSSTFRLRMAHAATEDDHFLSVSAWEVHQENVCTPIQVLTSLQAAVLKELGTTLARVARLKVFAVCGGDETKRFAKLAKHDLFGYCVVPLLLEEPLESPRQLVFASEPCTGKAAELSSTTILGAIRRGDLWFVQNALPDSVGRMILAPTSKEQQEFASDLDQLVLKVPSEVSWPVEKLMAKLPDSDNFPDNQLALIVLSSSLDPTHRGHLGLISKARSRLAERGYFVAGAWLSPWTDSAHFAEAQAAGTASLSSAFRLKVAELSVCDSDFVSVATWEVNRPAQNEGKLQFIEVANSLRDTLLQTFPDSLKDRRMSIFHVCSSTVARKYALSKGLAPTKSIGLVVVPDDEEDFFLESPNQLVFVTDGVNTEAGVTAKQIQADLATKSPAAMKVLSPPAARFLVAPTSAEIALMQADFRLLGIQPLTSAEQESTREKLQGTFFKRLGAKGQLQTTELSKLLTVLDPSLVQKDIDVLLKATKTNATGEVSMEDFLSLVFGR
jgi:nicotinic acid mononucleotide adenylyltransferase